MKKSYIALLACALCAGCQTSTRSISHSGYSEAGRAPTTDPGFEYRGELSEFDVLGISRGDLVSDAEIQSALAKATGVRLHPGSSVLLIQSGALFPDGDMVSELGKHFRVVPFSGTPPSNKTANTPQSESLDPESYSKSLRLTAARSGSDVILCYWGILESDNRNLPTKTVSWVPVVNWMVPDEVEHARIRLKLALIDVRSGNWTVFSPNPIESGRLSIRPRRGVADQKQVESLKQKAYEASVHDLVSRYSDVPI
ncbi:MAG: aminopeptidase [Verrucomicrobia bacterium]|nr:MAG: aminopeptidase [Verrucomicrobiota bacterium]